MIQRCTNSQEIAYCNYGAQGITVCKRWMKFENFLKDMGKRPTQKHTIDRIDNDQGYCKSNCRWATKQEQARNTKRNHLLSYGDKTQCLIEWAEELDINYQTLAYRIYSGWSTEKALTTPLRKRKK